MGISTREVIVFWVSLLTLNAAQFQIAAQQETSPYLENYNIENALPSPVVTRIIQDQEGFIWVGTFGGLGKFDGKDFIWYNRKNSLPHNAVWNMSIDNEDRIWIPRNNNHLGYLSNGQYNLHQDYSEQLSKKQVYLGFDIEDNYLFTWLSEDRLLIEDLETHESWSISLPTNNDMSKSNFRIYVKNKNIWLLNTGKVGINHIKDTLGYSIHSIQTEHNALLCFIDKSVFLSTNNSLYELIDQQLTPVLNFNVNGNHPVLINTMFENKDRYILNTSNGIYTCSIEFDQLVLLESFQGINIYTALLDKDKNLWFSAGDKGLFFCPAHLLQVFLNEKEVSKYGKQIQGLFVTDNHAYYGDGLGNLYQWEEGKSQFLASIPNWNKANTGFTYFDKLGSSLFIGGNNGLWSFDLNNGAIIPQAFVNRIERYETSIKSFQIIEDKLFYGAFRGIWKLDNTGVAEQMWLDTCRIYQTAKYSGNRMLVSSRCGYFSIDGKDVQPRPHLTAQIEPIAGAMLELNDSSLFIATAEGLHLIRNDLATLLDCTKGMYINKIKSFNNDLYLISDDGVTKVTGYDKHPLEASCIQFDRDNLLISNVVYDIDLVDSTVLVATNRGLQQLNLHDLDASMSALRLYIKEVQVGDSSTSANRLLEIKRPNSNFRLQLGAISFSNQEKLAYRYQLVGLDERSNISNSGEISYNNLPAGDYTLTLQVIERANQVVLDEHDLSIAVKPALHETPLFVLIYIAAGALVLVGLSIWFTSLYNRRKQQKLESEKRMIELELKSLQAQMNPHFISNALKSIQGFVLENQSDEASIYLSRFSKLMRLIMESSIRQIISIEEEVELLKNYMDLEILRSTIPVSYELNIDNELLEEMREIPSMMIQPILENCFKHAFKSPVTAGKIYVEIKRQDQESIQIIIEDNGIGLQEEKSNDSATSRGQELLYSKIELLQRNSDIHVRIKQTDSIHFTPDMKGSRVALIIKSTSLYA